MSVVFSSFVSLFITFLIGIISHLFPADYSVVKAFHIPAHKSSSSLVTRTATQTRSYQRKNIVPRAIHRTEFFGNTNEKLNPTLNFIPTTTCNNRMRYNIYIRNRNVFSTSLFSKLSDTTSNSEKSHAHNGHGHGGMMGGGDPNSFVQTELRKEAMRLHTKDQAKEGEQEAQTPFTKWIPERKDYVNFLVDSRHVYRKFEEIVNAQEELKSFRNTGLERSKALDMDLEWFQQNYPEEIKEIPPVGKYGTEYAKLLDEVAQKSIPAFMCHFYNHYFAHTAGGRMIGKKMASMLLDSHELNFYQWKDSQSGEEKDVKILLENVRKNMDVMAAQWDASQKEECVKETGNTFKCGGNLLSYIAKEPSQRN